MPSYYGYAFPIRVGSCSTYYHQHGSVLLLPTSDCDSQTEAPANLSSFFFSLCLKSFTLGLLSRTGKINYYTGSHVWPNDQNASMLKALLCILWK